MVGYERISKVGVRLGLTAIALFLIGPVQIITSDQKRWEFCVAAEERDAWVAAIEEQIEKALQNQMSKPSSRARGDREEVGAAVRVLRASFGGSLISIQVLTSSWSNGRIL